MKLTVYTIFITENNDYNTPKWNSKDGVTALVEAAEANSVPIVQLLLENGADCSAADDVSDTVPILTDEWLNKLSFWMRLS